jgi:hypothetical protein
MTQHAKRPSADAREQGAGAGLATHGAITYLHIPATDVRQAAAFYHEVFGWHINNPDSDLPSFDSPNAYLSGAWLSDHIATQEPGLLPYIYVDSIEDTSRGSSPMEAKSSPAPSASDYSSSQHSATPRATRSASGTTPHAEARHNDKTL